MSELRNKELIDLSSGNRLGLIGEADLVIDQESGKIISLVMPERGGGFSLFGRARETTVPWYAIKKIGADLVIVDLPGGELPRSERERWQ
ncbi:MAG: YlmC/YmxH family sporulation protein [Chloroflexota bacterium]